MTSLSRGLGGAPVESAGTHVEASETTPGGDGAHAEPSEKVLGIRPDSAPLVVAALIASLGLASGLWFSRWRWIWVVAGLGAFLFAVFDIDFASPLPAGGRYPRRRPL